jgi:hypothetical protein
MAASHQENSPLSCLSASGRLAIMVPSQAATYCTEVQSEESQTLVTRESWTRGSMKTQSIVLCSCTTNPEQQLSTILPFPPPPHRFRATTNQEVGHRWEGLHLCKSFRRDFIIPLLNLGHARSVFPQVAALGFVDPEVAFRALAACWLRARSSAIQGSSVL